MKVPYREGDKVAYRSVVAQLDDRVARKAFDVADKQASSDVAVRRATVQHKLAIAEYENAVAANARLDGTYPQGDIRRRRMAMESAELDVELARHELEIAKLNRDQAGEELNTYALTAPFDGEVAEILISEGNSAQPGEDVLELVNPKKLRVNGYVQYVDAWRLVRGDEVTIRVTDPAIAGSLEITELKGKLQAVATSVESVRRLVGVIAFVENVDGQFKDGMEVEMEIRPAGKQPTPETDQLGARR